jgi:hypothetical protein
MKQVHKANSNLIESTTKSNLDVKSMPDPEEIFSSILGAADTSQSYVNIPNIRDSDGNIILPYDYEKKLHDGSIVMVNVYLKL